MFYNLFFQIFAGKWLSQNNVYFCNQKIENQIRNKTYVYIGEKNNIIDNDCNKVEAILNNRTISKSRLSYNNKTHILTDINLKLDKVNQNIILNIQAINDNLSKITCIIKHKQIISEEYIHVINGNLIVSIVYIKDLINKKYLAISIGSHIKSQLGNQ
uniref:Uncharacterized protein n=1 Tax=Digenea simplex TaxID=945030 RepID=A0A1Z1MTT6_DIGSM|nr:hypothetical protein [Digenea simplex]ARW69517.1 hypothetical protein [Digenea simplex]